MSRILATRTLHDAARAHAYRLGLQVDEVDVLQIDLVADLESQWSATRRSAAESCDAWIFTSRNAVAALARLKSIGAVGALPACRAVGPGTAAALGAIGIDARPGPGTGQALGRLIATEGRVRRALHWRGDEVVGTLGPELRAAGIELDEWVVYRKRPRELTIDPTPYDAVLALSPSGVRALSAGLSAPVPDRLRFVAIGPTTAGEIERVFSREAIVANEPSLASMLDCAARETAHGSTRTPRTG